MSPAALGWYGSVFFWLFCTGIGIPPCPEEAGIIYAAGLTALHPEVRWWLAWPAAVAGICCADLTLYAIGRLWGRRLLEHRWVRRVLKPESFRRIEEKLHYHGVKLLLTARLLPPLRAGVFVTAGALRYRLARFLIADAVSIVLVTGTFFFGSKKVIELASLTDHWLIYAGAALVGAYALYRYHRYLQNKEPRSNPQSFGPAQCSPQDLRLEDETVPGRMVSLVSFQKSTSLSRPQDEKSREIAAGPFGS